MLTRDKNWRFATNLQQLRRWKRWAALSLAVLELFDRFISKTVEDMTIFFTMEDEQKIVCDLSNGAISSNNFDPWPRFQG